MVSFFPEWMMRNKTQQFSTYGRLLPNNVWNRDKTKFIPKPLFFVKYSIWNILCTLGFVRCCSSQLRLWPTAIMLRPFVVYNTAANNMKRRFPATEFCGCSCDDFQLELCSAAYSYFMMVSNVLEVSRVSKVESKSSGLLQLKPACSYYKLLQICKYINVLGTITVLSIIFEMVVTSLLGQQNLLLRTRIGLAI